MRELGEVALQSPSSVLEIERRIDCIAMKEVYKPAKSAFHEVEYESSTIIPWDSLKINGIFDLFVS